MTMRRFKQQLPETEVRQIMAASTSGVLSLIDADGRPYGVPLSFVCDGSRAVYFHCAREGRKLGGLRRMPDGVAASFCIVAQDDVRPETFTTYFRSVIAEGRLSVVESPTEIRSALQMLAGKYAPGRDSAQEIAKGIGHVTVLRLDIKSVTGKEAIELTRKREQTAPYTKE